jgi:hypothetical protein
LSESGESQFTIDTLVKEYSTFAGALPLLPPAASPTAVLSHRLNRGRPATERKLDSTLG